MKQEIDIKFWLQVTSTMKRLKEKPYKLFTFFNTFFNSIWNSLGITTIIFNDTSQSG